MATTVPKLPASSALPDDRMTGTLVISLDFELMWGVRDQPFAARYRENILGARAAIPRLLETFAEYDIHATWAAVGLLFFDNREDLLGALPQERPTYRNAALSPYSALHGLGDGEPDDPLHYAGSLIRRIASYPHQEIATHTFSHYYCLEPDQNLDAFRADLLAALQTARELGYHIESLVFPRNQFDDRHLEVCRELGIAAYRGVETSWLYEARGADRESVFRRGLRLMDSYVNLTGHHAYAHDLVAQSVPANIPSSRFLRPYSRALRALEPLKRRRVLTGLSHAAAHGLVYHLWWHPHNFGRGFPNSFAQLTRILQHFARLRDERGMECMNMGELAIRQAAGARLEHAR